VGKHLHNSASVQQQQQQQQQQPFNQQRQSTEGTVQGDTKKKYLWTAAHRTDTHLSVLRKKLFTI